VERGGLPLAALIGPANAHDSLSFAALLDAVPRIRQRRGGPRCRPAKLHADKGYDFERCAGPPTSGTSVHASPAAASNQPRG